MKEASSSTVSRSAPRPLVEARRPARVVPAPRRHGPHQRVQLPRLRLAEKAAVALLAGMPVISKPATSTALMSHRIMEIAVEQDLLPKGLALLHRGFDRKPPRAPRRTGRPRLHRLGQTGTMLRGSANILQHSTRVNIEADSLNAAITRADVRSGQRDVEPLPPRRRRRRRRKSRSEVHRHPPRVRAAASSPPAPSPSTCPH